MKQTINDWVRRIAICKKFNKPFGDEFYTDDEGNKKHRDFYPDRALLEQHIGLGTNASTIHFTRWYKELCSNLLKDVDWEITRDDKF